MRRFIQLSLIAIFLISITFGLVSTVLAATPPTGFADQTIATGISAPTAFAMAPDGRIFVLQQTGAVRIIQNGVLLPTPFLTLTVNSAGERGLLGIAFDPDFPNNQYIYLYYTATTPTVHNRVIRVTAVGNAADTGSIITLLDLENLSATNHNGGALHFGPDGKLYIAVGENAVGSNSQLLTNRLGKMLRINADGSIPSDNPFFATATGDNRAIWALGLRNPYTFSFQPGTGRMFINDVGQGTWEEINDGLPGANYGWPATEGPTSNPAFVSPLHAYNHSGGACAITGGAFYNPQTAVFPASYVGDYFFADFCASFIRSFDTATGIATHFAGAAANPVDLLVAPDGSLYYLGRGAGGMVGRIYYTLPTIVQHPSDLTVDIGESAQFDCLAVGEPTLSYQWQRNTSDIGGATSPTYTLPTAALSDDGATFRCVATNAGGNATSNEATLSVNAQQAPTITSTNSATFAEGFANTFTVTATGIPATMTFGVTGTLPAGVSLDPSTGVLSGIPTVGSAGTYPLTMTASNGIAPDATQNFTLTISKAAYSAEPVGSGSCAKLSSIVNLKLRGMVTGRTYTYTLEARDASTVYMIRQLPITFAGPTGTQLTLKWVIFPFDNVPALDAPQTYNNTWTSLPASMTLKVTAVDRTTNLMTQTTMIYTCATGAVSASTPVVTPNVIGAPYAP